MQFQSSHQTVFTSPSVENSIWYNGYTFSILLDGSQTEGAFSLIYCYFRRGNELPACYNQKQNETFYILSGEIKFNIGEKKFTAIGGDVVHKPKKVPHSFSLISETAKALLLITPAGFENFFKEFSVPAQSLELPGVSTATPSALYIQNMLKRSKELGVVWVPEF